MPSKRCLTLAPLMLAWVVAGTAARAEEKAPVVRAGESGDVEARLAKVERLVQSQGLLDLLAQVEKLQKDVQRLQGEMESQTHLIEQLEKKQRDLYGDTDRRLQTLEHGGTAPTAGLPPAATPLPAAPATNPPVAAIDSTVTAAPPGTSGPGNQAPSLTVETRTQPPASPNPPATPVAPAAGPAPAATNAPATTAAPANPPAAVAAAAPAPAATGEAGNSDQAYEKAFNLLKAGRYDQAIAEFNNFLVTYPSSARADSAQYWLGEAYYVSKQYQPAIVEYQKLVQAYPKSQKVSQALLKIGFSYHELGQHNQAKTTLEDLKQRFPGTTAARMAEDRLQRMRLEQNP